MTTEEIVQKAIDDLSVMINRSFSIVFEKLGTLEQKFDIFDEKLTALDVSIASVEKDVSQLKIHTIQTNKRLDLIDKKIWLAGLSFNQDA